MPQTVRPLHARAEHVRQLLASSNQAWVASASENGEAYLIPLTYHWDGRVFIFATPAKSRTMRDLGRAGVVRFALPSTEDVVIVDGIVETVLEPERARVGAEYAAHAGWDPLAEPQEYAIFHVVPDEIRAWQNAAELSGRLVMRNGSWLDRVSTSSGTQT